MQATPSPGEGAMVVAAPTALVTTDSIRAREAALEATTLILALALGLILTLPLPCTPYPSGRLPWR